MQVHLIDGTYELFRHFYGAPSRHTVAGFEVGAMRGVLSSVLGLIRDGATHLGVATDHVIESFRNEQWAGYKRGDGIDPDLLSQFHPLETTLEAMGVKVWPMEEYEADDALAGAAAALIADSSIARILICTPDKDLAQCVVGNRVVQLDRRARIIRDADGVREKFGVGPASIPDYLALVGDSADGFPGVRGWGAKSTALVLGRYEYLEAIPRDAAEWDVKVRGAVRLAGSLSESWEEALLFRELATLRPEAISLASVEELRWRGPQERFERVCAELEAPGIAEQAQRLAEKLSG